MTDHLRAQRAQLAAEFERRFHATPRVFRAPGRVNLIGEHTDYNDGFVMPAAIDFYTWVAMALRDHEQLAAESLNFPETLDASGGRPNGGGAGNWTDYVSGVVHLAKQAGCAGRGAALLVDGRVPVGSGLSSSAALEVSTGFAWMAMHACPVDLPALARLCQRAENEFVGARCGIMDQFISCVGRAGHAVQLDCRSLEYRYAPLPAGVAIVICNTMVKHSIAGGEYNQRRSECERGVDILRRRLPNVRALRDVTPEQLREHANELPPVVLKRCRHVIGEDARVLAAGEALQQGDLAELGRLMRESHESLRDDYQVSCAELDTLVELARAQEGVIGARMTGGGFGGCTVNLVREPAVDAFRTAVAGGYQRATGRKPEIYVSTASDGVHEVK